MAVATKRPPLIPPVTSPPKRPISAIQKARALDGEINSKKMGGVLPNSPPSGLLAFPGERY